MVILFLLLLLLTLLILIFVFKIINLTKEQDYNQTVNFLYKFSYFIVIIVAISYIISIIASFTLLLENDFVFVILIEMIFRLILFYLIFLDSKVLLVNLKKQAIFIKENSVALKKISTNFLYLAVIEIIGGLTIALIMYLSSPNNFNFTLQTDFTVFMFVIVGLILLIASMILDKAIDIYNENQLTI